MYVSHNELVTLSAKAFDSMQRRCGESDAIANMVVDLEMAGLYGVTSFVSALQFLDGDPEADTPDIQLDGKGIEVNLFGASLLCHFPALLDVAVEQLMQSRSATLVIRQCKNRLFAFGELNKLAGKGVSVRMRWSNGRAPVGIEYIHNAGSRYPNIYFGMNRGVDIQDVYIELSLQPFTCPSEKVPDISSEMQAASVKRAWENGIEVDDAHWQLLKDYASRLLVENSEMSLRGAGE
ncbi:DUF3726 domain-containing protein [Enterovibrio nigricans]|uniref:DUF3726 domain-containing protein n=1 Tax=Enterovibrio nigricans DSM 22720 TaxID=1121868 RepID=A0A1T4VDN3_9GAMM|nr:DUF3726 domain-containing protein [Enterovibrio nigricans]PKF49903.1 DUF3726 domain-containing protein [Enterovibrio nigricans]SKA63074.1 Protein of unknown function [Enterovibrio nigricans DSM 22720]